MIGKATEIPGKCYCQPGTVPSPSEHGQDFLHPRSLRVTFLRAERQRQCAQRRHHPAAQILERFHNKHHSFIVLLYSHTLLDRCLRALQFLLKKEIHHTALVRQISYLSSWFNSHPSLTLNSTRLQYPVSAVSEELVFTTRLSLCLHVSASQFYHCWIR
jgi:hypothetical protein